MQSRISLFKVLGGDTTFMTQIALEEVFKNCVEKII